MIIIIPPQPLINKWINKWINNTINTTNIQKQTSKQTNKQTRSQQQQQQQQQQHQQYLGLLRKGQEYAIHLKDHFVIHRYDIFPSTQDQLRIFPNFPLFSFPPSFYLSFASSLFVVLYIFVLFPPFVFFFLPLSPFL